MNLESAVKQILVSYKNTLQDFINVKTDEERVLVFKHLSNLLSAGEKLGCSLELHEILKDRIGELKW